MILNKFSKSENACRELRELCSRCILFPSKTRWMGILIVYKRILEIFESINEVSEAHRWGNISLSDKKSIHDVVELLNPLSEALLLWESEDLTISTVHSGIYGLYEYYEVRSCRKLSNQKGF